MSTLSIKIPNVSESLEKKLEAMILGGAFWPDMPIASERRLADEFDVSRTSLRNALASLLERGLLSQIGKRYFATNIMAELLGPGLTQTAHQNPAHLLNYWVLLFESAVRLAGKKAQNSDRVAIEKAAVALQENLLGGDPTALIDCFDRLNRAVFDGCYNFFLSQTHQALMSVMQPRITASLTQILANPDVAMAFSKAVGDLSYEDHASAAFREALSIGFAPQDSGASSQGAELHPVDASQLVDVVLRNPLFLEAVYELRLITETHAAPEAAEHAEARQLKQLAAHFDYMTAINDSTPSQYSKLDTELHRLIAECTHNPVFAVIDAALAPVFSHTTNQWLKKHLEMRSDQSVIHLQHAHLVDAIVARDLAKSQTAMNEHLAYVLRNLSHLRQQDQLQEISFARRLLR